jgi:spore maturation protein CgeB
LISDDWPGIETVFAPGAEILLASGPRDVIQILNEISDDRRLTIASNARARLLREHTPVHRARQLELYYQEALTNRQSLVSTNRRRIELEEVK